MSTRDAARVVAWETTRRCALNCRHCRGAARDTDYAGELTTGECLRVIDSLAAFTVGAASSVSRRPPLLILTGGEPMSRADIYALAAHATDAGLTVVMAPCGHRLTPTTVARLKAAGVKALSISLDGATAAAHDAFRGVAGVFGRTCRGIGFAREAGIPFQVNTTVTRENVGELRAIHDLAVRLGAAKLDLFFLVPTGRGAALRDMALSAPETDAALRAARALSHESPIGMKITCAPQSVRIWAETAVETAAGDAPARGPSAATGCMAGAGFVFISHTGILQPCGFLDIAAADLRANDLDFGAAYRGSVVFAALADRAAYTGACAACGFRDACGGCRARALAASGDYLGDEPACGYGGDSRK